MFVLAVAASEFARDMIIVCHMNTQYPSLNHIHSTSFILGIILQFFWLLILSYFWGSFLLLNHLQVFIYFLFHFFTSFHLLFLKLS